MSKGSTIHASSALNALHASEFLNFIIRGSICDPALGGSTQHPNAAFFGDVEWYLTCRQIAYAGDILNTYCQSVLADILDCDAQTWPKVESYLRAKTREKAVDSLRVQREPDGSVRQALREGLPTPWCGELEIIAELRNRIVHQAGTDPEGKLPKVISEFPPGKSLIPPAALDPADFPVAWDANGRLLLDARTGYWATQHVIHNIHLLDREFRHRFQLSCNGGPIRKIGFTVGANSHALRFLPGTPLPVKPKPPLRPAVSALLPPPHEYTDMSNQDEIECSAAWSRVRSEIHTFIAEQCSCFGVEICGLETTLSGSVLPHTIAGHDQHLGLDLRPLGGKSKSVYVGIRFRQAKFKPFVTVWGTHAQMCDFSCELNDQLRDYLRECVCHTLSH
jgi:hypothetical protein